MGGEFVERYIERTAFGHRLEEAVVGGRNVVPAIAVERNAEHDLRSGDAGGEIVVDVTAV